jgi:type VI secretion system secreted protein VgrG
MAGGLSQDGRIGSLTTPLGENVLVLSQVEANEALSELFDIRIEVVSEQQNVDFNSALGLNCAVTINTIDQLKRYFNGVLVEASWSGVRGDLYVYKLVLRPWVWLLGHSSDCRIFSNKTVPEIIKQVFQDRGFSDFRDALTESYPSLEYTVQYRESDLNFICRLMEEYGIYYFFEHTDSKHTMVLADAKSCHQPVPGLANDTISFLPGTVYQRRDSQLFEDWATLRGVQSGHFVLNDYDYNNPGTNLLGDAQKSGGYAHGTMEMFDYPGRYDKQSEGNTLAKVKLDADQAHDERRSAIGSAPSLFPGSLVKLDNHPAPSENVEYLVLRCRHSYASQEYRSGGSSNSNYSGVYEFAKSDRPFRAPQIARKAIVYGPQSALVVGEKGEEIDVDKLGRVCVQFYWDRKKTASRRVRVAQFWAGSHRGALFLPRIGDEVMIAYEDGDPDRPLVVGSVYNGDNTVPADLPSKKTHSGILTKSSKNSSGYNMLLFDDTAGSEKIKLRAEKDLMFKALNNEQRDILGSQTENIGGDETITVGGPTGGGNFTLNAVKTVTINVGPVGSPLTQIVMDTKSITLNIGPGGQASQIVMNPTGITLTSPNITLSGDATVSVSAPMVSINGA